MKYAIQEVRYADHSVFLPVGSKDGTAWESVGSPSFDSFDEAAEWLRTYLKPRKEPETIYHPIEP